jgi:tRNA-binding protein
MNQINWSDFEKIEIRTGTIIKAEEFLQTRNPAYKLTIDFGKELGIKSSSAQITKHYQLDELEGRQIIAVVNFPPKQIATFISECLVLSVYDESNNVVLLQPSHKLSNSLKIG